MEQYAPLLKNILGGLIRTALGGVFVWLLERGVIHESDVETIITALTTFGLVGWWLVTSEIKKLRQQNTAAAMGPSTPQEVKETVKAGAYAPAVAPTDRIPIIVDNAPKRDDGKASIGALLIIGGILAVLFSSACSLPLKQRVSAAHQGVRGAIVLVDDTERRLCAPAPAPNTNTCTNPTAATIALTDLKHQEISRSLVTAYDADIKAGTAIIAWQPGDPMPESIGALLKAAEAALAVAKTIVSAPLLEQAETMLAKASALAELFLKD